MRWQIANQARSVELAIIISYPTSASGVIVLLKTLTKYREFFPTLFVKTAHFQLVFNFEQTSIRLPYYHDGQANQSSRMALSNYSVFNNVPYGTISRDELL